MVEMHRAPHVNARYVSKRAYTTKELNAAKRLGHARRGKAFTGNGLEVITAWNGAVFWAGGTHLRDEIDQLVKDAQIVQAALHREWDNLDAIPKEKTND